MTHEEFVRRLHALMHAATQVIAVLEEDLPFVSVGPEMSSDGKALQVLVELVEEYALGVGEHNRYTENLRRKVRNSLLTTLDCDANKEWRDPIIFLESLKDLLRTPEYPQEKRLYLILFFSRLHRLVSHSYYNGTSAARKAEQKR